MPSLKELVASPVGVVAPLILNPLMAKLAEHAGFRAGYVGGGTMGFLNCGTEANLSLTQMIQAGLEIRTVTHMPLVLDGTCGWGDPVHVRHTVLAAQAAGYQAIEIEDQVLPKRVHHHIGIERIIDADLMAAKITEAVAARHDSNFLVIARTNAARVTTIDDALRRGEAFHRLGADVLLLMPKTTDDLYAFSERMPAPLMCMLPVGGIKAIGLTMAELNAMGFRLIVDPATPFFAIHRALRQCYEALYAGQPDPLLGGEAESEERMVHKTIDLATMLEIERRTLKTGTS